MAKATDAGTVIPMPHGGQYSAGDASKIPADTSRLVRNLLHRPGDILEARPPFTYDGLLGITGLLTWGDVEDNVQRFGAIDQYMNFYLKDVGAETWGPTIPGGTGFGTRLTSYCTYRGNLYAMFDDGAGVPHSVWMYDGETLIADSIPSNPYVLTPKPFAAGIAGLVILPFEDRLIILAGRLSIFPYNNGGALAPTTTAYDWTGAAFTPTNLTVAMTTLTTGVQSCRLTPTSTASHACQIQGPAGLLTFVQSTDSQAFTMLAEVRGVDPLFDVPFTMELYLATTAVPLTSYVQGDIMAVGAFMYRAKVGGLSAAVPPVYGIVTGADTVDGTVTWTNVGPSVFNALEDVVPSISASPDFTAFYLSAAVPPRPTTVEIGMRLKFWNTDNPSLLHLSPIDISLKDGKADTDPSKANHGWQWTAGLFLNPFFNCETALFRVINLEDVIWSETSQPSIIRATNFFQLQEEAGLPTAGAISAKRLVVFKRQAFWTFSGTGEPDNPLLPEDTQIGIGALGPMALDQMYNTLFFLAEDSVYSMIVGSPPQDIAGDAMRRQIMARGSAWVESQATFNMPLIACDRKNRDVWVYTQRGILFCWHGTTGQWSQHDVGQDGTLDVSALAYNPVTQEMEVAFGGRGLTRLDPSQTYGNTLDTIDDGTAITSSAEVVLRPVELFAPRGDAIVEEIAPYHSIQTKEDGTYFTQAGTLTMRVSYDRGKTFPNFDTVTFDVDEPRIPLALFQFGNSVTLALKYEGPLGAYAWALSKTEATVQLLTSELAQVLPSQVGSNL